MSSTAAPDAVQDFDAAKTIFGALDPLPKGRQERVIRWVSEALGITALPAAPTSATPTPPGTPDAPLPVVAGKAIDIQTFMRERQPKSDIQFVTAVAYYYRFKAPVADQRTTIDSKFAQEATRLAGRNRLGKPLKALQNARGKGYLDSAVRGQFTINTVGENMVESLPAGASDTKKAHRQQTKSKKPPKKKAKGVRK